MLESCAVGVGFAAKPVPCTDGFAAKPAKGFPKGSWSCSAPFCLFTFYALNLTISGFPVLKAGHPLVMVSINPSSELHCGQWPGVASAWTIVVRLRTIFVRRHLVMVTERSMTCLLFSYYAICFLGLGLGFLSRDPGFNQILTHNT